MRYDEDRVTTEELEGAIEEAGYIVNRLRVSWVGQYGHTTEKLSRAPSLRACDKEVEPHERARITTQGEVTTRWP